ncbi:hypothetical protein E2562_006632 [Oryza meyeriana var. granulata]|uniref:Uncharacterized protein n=1 Tax=Oryza meyeriana var. granulata TaxID=110450 RepID=A0A6G1EGX5_9ORYZ|nr:hypothetical protein E2562_006632 [Oryza meyeriana var. granulata]
MGTVFLIAAAAPGGGRSAAASKLDADRRTAAAPRTLGDCQCPPGLRLAHPHGRTSRASSAPPRRPIVLRLQLCSSSCFGAGTAIAYHNHHYCDRE